MNIGSAHEAVLSLYFSLALRKWLSVCACLYRWVAAVFYLRSTGVCRISNVFSDHMFVICGKQYTVELCYIMKGT
jgi:hypothetical protein